MTQETPAKVFSLLGVAMASMFFLFAVTISNASFSKVEQPLPDIFGPQRVMAVLDQVSNSYNNFLSANLFVPFHQDVAYYQDAGRWIIDNSDMSILKIVGLDQLAAVPAAPAVNTAPAVAGAYTDARMLPPVLPGFSVNTLMAALSLR